jgi:hypothetical protein
MIVLISSVALALGIFIAASPDQATRLWGWKHINQLEPRHKTLYLCWYRALASRFASRECWPDYAKCLTTVDSFTKFSAYALNVGKSGVPMLNPAALSEVSLTGSVGPAKPR